MSRSVSTYTVAVLLLLALFATFASAAPASVNCGGHDGKGKPDKVTDVPPVPESTPKVDNPDSPTNNTVVDDGTGDDGVVNPADINTLATRGYSGTVGRFRAWRSIE